MLKFAIFYNFFVQVGKRAFGRKIKNELISGQLLVFVTHAAIDIVAAVFAVAQNEMPDACKVRSNLMRPAGYKLDVQNGAFGKALGNDVFRDNLLRAPLRPGNDGNSARFGVLQKIRLKRFFVVRDFAIDVRLIELMNVATFERVEKLFLGVFVFGETRSPSVLVSNLWQST